MIATVQELAPSLLRVARRHSDCADDAEEAYQRAIEIFLRRMETDEVSNVAGWLRTIVKHEAHAVRADRRRYVGEPELDAHHPSLGPAPDDRAESYEQVERAAEALQRCKPHEALALVLKAQGLSYREIAERQGWSYTKTNRSITEGRRRFLERFAEIDSGAECERWTPILSALADGEADATQLTQVRPHLRNCRACRATVRELHASGSRVAAVAPIGAVALGSPAAVGEAGGSGFLIRAWEAIAGGMHDRAAASAMKLQMALDAAGAAKVAAVAASTVAIAGGGAAVTERAGKREAAKHESASAVAQTARPAGERRTTVRAPRTRRARRVAEFGGGKGHPSQRLSEFGSPRRSSSSAAREFGGTGSTSRPRGGEFGAGAAPGSSSREFAASPPRAAVASVAPSGEFVP